MGRSPYVERVRAAIGHELLLLPSVAVLPRDDDGRVLLVRFADDGTWASIGGAVDPDEAPETAALRESREEAGVEVELRGIIAALGGPDYRMSYPNGDEAAYVCIVYDAVVVGGSPRPDGDETTEVAWFAPAALSNLDIGRLNRRLLDTVFGPDGCDPHRVPRS